MRGAWLVVALVSPSRARWFQLSLEARWEPVPGYAKPAVFADADGIAHLRGAMRRTAGAAPTVSEVATAGSETRSELRISAMPEAFRPSMEWGLPVLCEDDDASEHLCQVLVKPDGSLALISGRAGRLLSLSSVAFALKAATADFEPIGIEYAGWRAVEADGRSRPPLFLKTVRSPRVLLHGSVEGGRVGYHDGLVFFSNSRSMPTANAEDPYRSEGT